MMLEKVETLKNKAGLSNLLTNQKVKYVVGTILLSGVGIALPRIFHVLAGTSAGATFLPMHLAVLIAALTFGTISSTVVAGSSVIFSYLLTGMPTLARFPYMAIELVIYAVVLSIANKKFSSYLSLIITIILGRMLYSLVLLVAAHGLGLPTYGISVMESIKAGIPGLVMQLLCVPFIAKFIKERLNLKND